MPKRSPRKKIDRPAPIREPYDRVLIVCEGARTEPNYLRELRDHYRLSTANIEVFGTGDDPLNLVKRALLLAKEERRRVGEYDCIYCVFDRDSHAHFDHASTLAAAKGVSLARSWPCFEFWILLHFLYTRKPYSGSGGKSPADNCIADVGKHIPGYRKGSTGLFSQLLPRLPQAGSNAAQAMDDAHRTGGRNPSTEFYELVEYLQSLSSALNPAD